MSTILKALRRLEQEKAEEQPSALDSRVAALGAVPRPGPGRIRRVALLLACALLGLGGGALLTWLALVRDDAVSPPRGSALEPVAAAPGVGGLVSEPRHSAMPAPEPLRSSTVPEGRAPQEPLSPPPARPPQVAPEPVVQGLPPVAVLRREHGSERGSAGAVATESAAVGGPEAEAFASPGAFSAPPPSEVAAAGPGQVQQESETAWRTSPIQPPQVEKAVLAERAEREGAPIVVRKPLPELIVKRTVWHPDSKRRVASVQVEGHSGLLELREGDAIGDLTVVEITPSGVSFDHGGVELYKRLGGG